MSKLGQRIAYALNIQILKDNPFMTGLVTIAVSILLIVVEIICLFKWTRKETRK
jgi:cell division protein FtsX